MAKDVNERFMLDHISKVEGIAAVDYDVFLAHDIDNLGKLEERITLYNAIGAACERLGLKPFIPYRFLSSKEWGDLSFRDIYTILHSIMIPVTDLFLCDISTLSTSINEMRERASWQKKPQIYFYERYAEPEKVYAGNIQVINYKGTRDTIKKLEVAIKNNYPFQS